MKRQILCSLSKCEFSRNALGALRGQIVLDAGSGTGRWMSHAQSAGARAFGLDACREMVLEAERKPGLRGRSALADIREIPVHR